MFGFNNRFDPFDVRGGYYGHRGGHQPFGYDECHGCELIGSSHICGRCIEKHSLLDRLDGLLEIPCECPYCVYSEHYAFDRYPSDLRYQPTAKVVVLGADPESNRASYPSRNRRFNLGNSFGRLGLEIPCYLNGASGLTRRRRPGMGAGGFGGIGSLVGTRLFR